MFQPEIQQWYVVYSKPHKEECAQFYLRLKGIDVFFPQLLLPEPLKRRKRIIPLFPSYLFVKIKISTEFQFVQWSPWVKRLVCVDGVPTPLDEDVVAFLMQQATPDGVIAARSNLMAGQEVRITGGPFQGLLGIIQNPPDARGRVNLLLNLLNRQVKVAVPLRFVDSGWVAVGAAPA